MDNCIIFYTLFSLEYISIDFYNNERENICCCLQDRMQELSRIETVEQYNALHIHDDDETWQWELEDLDVSYESSWSFDFEFHMINFTRFACFLP